MSEPDRKLPEEVKRFLEQPRVAVLATVRRDGTPASTACWYELQDSRVLITMYATARRLPNIRSTPHVAMTILGEDPYQHVSISGPVIETWDDPALEVMDRLSMRYTGEPWPEREECVSALVEIERWHTYGVLSESSDYGSLGAVVMTPARRKVKSVLVTYEPSREGDAALSSRSTSRGRPEPAHVASVAPRERTDVGCARCKASARVWNEQLRLLAHERLSEAAKAIGDAPDVRYLAACGPERQVLAQAARECEADIVVVPWRRAERLRRLVRLSLAEDLSLRGPWEVVIAPRTASSPPPTPEPRGATARAAGMAAGDDTEHHRFPASA